MDLWLLVTAIVVIFFMTIFAIVGIATLINTISQILAVHGGAYKVYFRLPNHRKRTAYLKPEKESIRDSRAGKTYPFANSLGYVWYEGNTPTIEYDVNGNQLNFINLAKTSAIDPSALDTLYMRAFNLGKAKGKMKDTIVLIFQIIGIIINVAVLLLVLNIYNNITAVMTVAAV